MRPGSANCIGLIGVNDTDNPNLNLTLFPNPTNNNLFMSYLLDESAKVNISVFNLFGQEVYSVKEVQGTLNEIPLANYPSGFYLVKIQIDKHFYIGKVIKQ